MYFKKLEIVGFKSFAEKTVLQFERGVTAVVGPNGCGKSNIVDSIKWVLGEQAVKTLRGTKMEDVIFNGTDAAEPLNMAEVSIVLSDIGDNLSVETGEVTITRRLFRSGESEYLINKAPVRLKDISELLMGTGIGMSAYSIIEQGKIDMIVGSKPEDRREVFEEASGITKFKAKKCEAARKLESTAENLIRIGDIINEVKRQITSITRQTSKAERYKERFERLKELEIKVADHERSSIAGEMAAAEENLMKVRSAVAGADSEIERLSREAGSYKQNFGEAEANLSVVQDEKFAKEGTIEYCKNKADMDRERIGELNARGESLKTEIEALKKKVEMSESSLADTQRDLSELSDDEEVKRDILADKESRLVEVDAALKEAEEGIRVNKLKAVELMSEHSKCRNDIVRITSDIQHRSVRLRRLTIERENVNGELRIVRESETKVRAAVDGLNMTIGRIRARLTGLEGRFESASGALSELRAKQQKTKDDLAGIAAKRTFLDDLIRRYEGYSAGAKAILQAKESGELDMPGIRGVLGSMLDPEPGFQAVIEAALGDRIQDMVCDTKEAALEAVRFLRERNLGRASFTILSDLAASQSGGPYEEMRHDEGVIDILSDLVSADAVPREALRKIFGGTFLVEGLDSGLGLSRRGGIYAGARFVTKAGDIIQEGRIIGGAAFESGEFSIVGRAAKLREMESAIDIVSEMARRLNEEIAAGESEIAAIDEEMAAIESSLKVEETRCHKEESRHEAISREAARLDEELSVLQSEIDEINEDVKSVSLKKADLEERVKELEVGENNTQQLILDSQDIIKDLSKEREEAMVLIAELKTSLAAIGKEKEGISVSLAAQEANLTADRALGMSKERESDEVAAKRYELADEIKELDNERARLTRELEGVNARLVTLKSDREASFTRMEHTDGKLKELYKNTEGLREREHELEMAKTNLVHREENLRTRLNHVYKLVLDDIPLQEHPAGTDWAVIKAEIEELERRLESMGPVNLVALDERKELDERLAFLTGQQGDLIQAKDSLEKAIIKINKTTRKMFLETFEKIQIEFKNYFRFLFNGGNAEIVLLDEHDVLECGIDIVVRPPGKRLQNISLLSGGEKALTAMALVFSMFKVKPSPFCLLDEVDAPLDESNIDRFSKALQEFTQRSQFIVITHNKKTITLADVMYGITMEKSGISKIVSVKFQDPHKERPRPIQPADAPPAEEAPSVQE